MWPSAFVSVVLILSCVGLGALTTIALWTTWAGTATGLAAGLLLGVAVLLLLRYALNSDLYSLLGVASGILVGVVVASLLTLGFPAILGDERAAAAVRTLVLVIFMLIGMEVGKAKAREFRKKGQIPADETRHVIGILDTSVIIDGRLAGICETGFLSGKLIIPDFVLRELQNIADSQDPMRRTRGRRGLDVLNRIKKQSNVAVIIDNTDYPAMTDVDPKLIKRAKETGYPIITNDFNLNKVAEVHSIRVLNINQLANALKPIMLPGESMKVHIVREGKEPAQGIAFLDDGTMVVVEHGRKYQGQTIETTVTSVLQTPAGRMIFAMVKE